MPGYRKEAKRILYMLYKQPNRKLNDFRKVDGGDYTLQDRANLRNLRRLKAQGKVDMTEYSSSGNIYYLTSEGKKVASEIVREIDNLINWYTGL